MKEQDSMKDFFEQNQSAFDDKEVPEGLWEAIEADLPAAEPKQIRMVPLRTVLRVAAVVAVIFAGGMAWLIQSDKPGTIAENIEAENAPEHNALQQYPELAEAEFYYQVRITEAEEALAEYRIEEDDYETLALLEEELNSLRNELGDQVDNERLIEAMMQIYQYKLSTLEQMLKQVKSIDNEEDSDDEVVVVSM
jgi:hypothetical protein